MFTIVLPEETFNIVKKIASQTGKSYADIISMGIQKLIEPIKEEEKKHIGRVARFGSKQKE